eukprot:TRINITY_DN12190_c0_g1_i4.p1 TRINITY_DN12190_c0_g1~~TRINITY_DN12190_c0_g1_i4.p1  ORF type:complete len:151 (-),score=14.68 TRINITY_DN12190_c0_g1_i4:155-607(-)
MRVKSHSIRQMKWVALHLFVLLLLAGCYLLTNNSIKIAYSPHCLSSRTRLLLFLFAVFSTGELALFLIFHFIKWRIACAKKEKLLVAQQERISVREYEYKKRVYTQIQLAMLRETEEFKRMAARKNSDKNWQATEKKRLHKQNLYVEDEY